jgi:hypothetical protein
MKSFLPRSGRTRASLALAFIAVPLLASLSQIAGADVGDIVGCGVFSLRTDPSDLACAPVPGLSCVTPSTTHVLAYGADKCGVKMIGSVPVPCGLPARVEGECP